ncbi:unnamed protein product, partial [Iphiclides podalirius]
MKVTIVFLSTLALIFSAPQPRKNFHRHADDFLDLILDESFDEIFCIMDRYLEYEEFTRNLDYLAWNFRHLVYEIKLLPEFKAMTDFLKQDNISIWYFIDLLDEIIEDLQDFRTARHLVSGRNMTAFINDCVAVFPQNKLTGLYKWKIAKDKEFRVAMENLQSEEWNQICDALWSNETFIGITKILNTNGIDLQVLVYALKATFGQF